MLILDHCLHGGSIAAMSIQIHQDLLCIQKLDNQMCPTTSGASIAETFGHTLEPGNDYRKQNCSELLSFAVKILLYERIIFNKFNAASNPDTTTSHDFNEKTPETYHEEKPFISSEWLVEPHAATKPRLIEPTLIM